MFTKEERMYGTRFTVPYIILVTSFGVALALISSVVLVNVHINSYVNQDVFEATRLLITGSTVFGTCSVTTMTTILLVLNIVTGVTIIAYAGLIVGAIKFPDRRLTLASVGLIAMMTVMSIITLVLASVLYDAFRTNAVLTYSKPEYDRAMGTSTTVNIGNITYYDDPTSKAWERLMMNQKCCGFACYKDSILPGTIRLPLHCCSSITEFRTPVIDDPHGLCSVYATVKNTYMATSCYSIIKSQLLVYYLYAVLTSVGQIVVYGIMATYSLFLYKYQALHTETVQYDSDT